MLPRSLAVAGSGALLAAGLVVAAPSAHAAQFCGGQAVTIDMSVAGHPDPNRDAADVVLGTPGADAADLGGGNDVMCGLGGWDIIEGGAGDDQLLGGNGPDLLDGGLGNDVLDGGDGKDAISFPHGTTAVHIDLAITDPQDTGPVGIDTLRRLEGVSGTAFGDTLLGSSANDFMQGKGGADVIRGRGGKDQMRGHAGNDRIYGGAGDDDLRGAAGDDLVDGGDGNDFVNATIGRDILKGGAGTDLLETGDDSVSDSATAGAGRDLIFIRVGDKGYGGPGVDECRTLPRGEKVDATMVSCTET